MNFEARELLREPKSRTTIIDVDIHPKASAEDLRPFLSARWWEHLQTYGNRGRQGFAKGFPYPKSQPLASRRDSWPPGGGLPASDLDFMRRQHLDFYGIEYAIMNPLSPTGQGDQNEEFSAAMAFAANEFQLEGWNRRDPRLLASVVVPYRTAKPRAPRSSAAPAIAASPMCCCAAAPPSSWARSATGRSTRRRRRPAFRLASTFSGPAGGRRAIPAGRRSISRT
jgi:hypothetical protein